MTLSERRRALMMATEKPPIDPINFAPGSFTHETSAWNAEENNSGELTITVWGNAWSKRITAQLSRNIKISSGDVVRFVVKKVSGTLSARQFADVYIDTLAIAANAAWSNGTTALEKTVTASSDITANVIDLSNRTGTATATNYKVKITIYINGQQAFPLP